MTNAGMLENTQSLHYNDTSGKTMDLLGWCKVQGKLNLSCSPSPSCSHAISLFN